MTLRLTITPQRAMDTRYVDGRCDIEGANQLRLTLAPLLITSGTANDDEVKTGTVLPENAVSTDIFNYVGTALPQGLYRWSTFDPLVGNWIHTP